MAGAALSALLLIASAAWWFFPRWRHRAGRRRRLVERLARAGAASADLADADAFVRFEPEPEIESDASGRRGFDALLLIEGRALRILADEPRVAEAFAAESLCGADCATCGAAWVCGGRGLRLRLRLGGREECWRIRPLEGRTRRREAAALRALVERLAPAGPGGGPED